MSQERKLARVGLPDLGWSAGGGGAPSGSKSAFAQLINNRDPISGKHGCFTVVVLGADRAVSNIRISHSVFLYTATPAVPRHHGSS